MWINVQPLVVTKGWTLFLLWVFQMDNTLCQIIKGIRHGGGQIFEHIGLQKDRCRLKAQRKDRRLVLQMDTEPLHSGGTVSRGGVGVQKLVCHRIGPATVIQGASGTQQRGEVPVGGQFDLPVIEVKVSCGQCGGVLSPGKAPDRYRDTGCGQVFGDFLNRCNSI